MVGISHKGAGTSRAGGRALAPQQVLQRQPLLGVEEGPKEPVVPGCPGLKVVPEGPEPLLEGALIVEF